MKKWKAASSPDRVDDLVQPVPVPAEPLDGGVRGGRAQRYQAKQRDEADGEVEAQRDLGRDAKDVELEVDV